MANNLNHLLASSSISSQIDSYIRTPPNTSPPQDNKKISVANDVHESKVKWCVGIGELSNEVLADIFSYLPRQELVNCGRTTRWWVRETIRLLFKTVRLDSWKRVERFLHTLREVRHLKGLVKTLLINFLDDDALPPAKGQVMLKRLFAATKSCTLLGILSHDIIRSRLSLLEVAYALLFGRTDAGNPIRVWIDPRGRHGLR